MPYYIDVPDAIPALDDPVITDISTNAADELIDIPDTVPALDDPICNEIVANPADVSISKSWTVPLNLCLDTTEYLVYRLGFRNTRSTMNVLPGIYQMRHIYPERILFRAQAFTWKFKLVSSINAATPEPGVLPGDITVYYSIDGLPFVEVVDPVTEIEDAWYQVSIPVEGTNSNTIALMATDGAGIWQSDELIHIYNDDMELIPLAGGTEYTVPTIPTPITSEKVEIVP